MEVKQGGTRIVLVFSTIVVKIPKIKVIRPIIRFFYHLIKNQFMSKLKKFDDENMVKAGMKYLLCGLYANKLEYYYSKAHPQNNKIVPVYGILFYLILIQKRVKIVNEDDKKWKKLLKRYLKQGVEDIDMLAARNFGFDENKIKLIDYGREETIFTLNHLCLS